MLNKIVGHEFQKNLLMRAAREGIVSHSYLFSGPDGVGKKLVAIEFAKILNCTSENKYSEVSECDCGSCRKVGRGTHPDVVLVEYEGVNNIKVDQIREGVEDKLFLKPYEGSFKVVIVDESERMNRSAQNAFLKTLEEPPPNSVIILLASRPHALLPTVRSRCQIVRFSPLSQETIVQILEERTELSAADALLSARLSEGSPGLALKFDKEVIEWRKELLIKVSELSRSSAGDILGLADSMLTGTTPEDMERLLLAMEFISLWLRDLVLIKIGADKKYMTHTDLIEASKKAAAGLSTHDILERHKNLQNTRDDIFYANANKQLSLENLFIKLAFKPGSI